MHWVTAVRYLKDYRLLVTFENGVVKLVDLEHHLSGEVFGTLKDKRRFRQVALNCNTETIEWPNGADMSPDFLYEIGTIVASRSRQRRMAGA